MKKFILLLALLTLVAGLAEGIVLILIAVRVDPLRMRIDPWALGALLESLALILGVFVGLTYASFVKQLRHWAIGSAWVAFGAPFLLLIPYLIFAFGTGTFSLHATAKLAAYIGVPTVLLLPDRLRRTDLIGWRDFAAMLALGVPVAGHWLEGVWAWPQELYFFRPLYSVCVGAYGFMAIRNLEGIGYRLGFRKGDVVDGLSNFTAFGLLAIPLGFALHFIHFHSEPVSAYLFAFQLHGMHGAIVIPGALVFAGLFASQAFAIYLTVAIPEEFLFRGIFQNFLVKSFGGNRRGLYGILLASVVFGASHLHHAPVPNWRYGIMATLAGIFYGNAYRTRARLSASSLTHTLVDTTWHFWF